MMEQLPRIVAAAILIFVFGTIIYKYVSYEVWFRNMKRPCRVIYNDGGITEVMPFHVAQTYANIFGGVVEEAPGEPLARWNYRHCPIE